MSTLGIHLNDAALAVASAGQLSSTESSIVHADPANASMMGRPATTVARLTPRTVSVDHWATLARLGRSTPASTSAVIRSELRHKIDEAGRSPIQCAVSPAFSAESLGALLSIARAEGFELVGFHDAAALTVSALGLEGVTLVIEFALGHVCATRVDADADNVRRRGHLLRRGSGWLALQQAWLQLIAEAMVLKTRFDPLHQGASEQCVYDLLPQVIASATANGSADIELPVGNDILRVSLTRDQFAEAAGPIYDDILAVLHELRPAGMRLNILLDEALLEFPGLLAKLGSLRGCRIFAHPTGLAARAASLQPIETSEDGTVPMQRGYAAREVIERPTELDLTTFRTTTDLAPTHVLWEGRAVALPASGLIEIGRSAGIDGVRLADGLAGVSRLHCSLHIDTAGVTLIPHSDQGTWLNDERVRGRVRVQSGDRLRVGTPGVVLDLIAVGGVGHGAST